MHAFLIGNYGAGNLGDELLREYFLRRFPNVRWTVVSARASSANEVPRLPLGFHSLLQPWWRTIRALRRADVVVFGGGTLFTDGESVVACLLWGWHAFVAWLFRKPVYLAYQGIGPFRTGIGTGIARWVIRHAAFVSVRDTVSRERVLSLVPGTKVVQTCDPVVLLITRQNQDVKSQNVFTIIPRRNSPHTFLVRAGTLWRTGVFSATVILSLQPDDPAEKDVCLALQRSLPGARIREIRSIDALLHALSGSVLVYSQRFHGALAALTLGIPFETASQREGDKLSALLPSSRTELLAFAQTGEEALKEALEKQAIR
jgi:polysaccharide pyruvyl transferase WcaK-like protein